MYHLGKKIKNNQDEYDAKCYLSIIYDSKKYFVFYLRFGLLPYILQIRNRFLTIPYTFEGTFMKTAQNKRSEARYGCDVPVEGKTGSEFDQTKTVDISRHGIGFISSHPIPVNQKIAVELALKPDTEPVLVIGVVKWVRKISDGDKYRVGMTFSEVISGSPTRLDKYFNAGHSAKV